MKSIDTVVLISELVLIMEFVVLESTLSWQLCQYSASGRFQRWLLLFGFVSDWYEWYENHPSFDL